MLNNFSTEVTAKKPAPQKKSRLFYYQNRFPAPMSEKRLGIENQLIT